MIYGVVFIMVNVTFRLIYAYAKQILYISICVAYIAQNLRVIVTCGSLPTWSPGDLLVEMQNSSKSPRGDKKSPRGDGKIAIKSPRGDLLEEMKNLLEEMKNLFEEMKNSQKISSRRCQNHSKSPQGDFKYLLEEIFWTVKSPRGDFKYLLEEIFRTIKSLRGDFKYLLEEIF